MNLYDELKHLMQRRDELKTVIAKLDEISDWFARHEGKLESNVDCDGLPTICCGIENVNESIDEQIAILEDKIDE
jgi:hypothetical protein